MKIDTECKSTATSSMICQDHEIHGFPGVLALTLGEAFIHVRIPWPSNTCGGTTGKECSIKAGWRCEDV